MSEPIRDVEELAKIARALIQDVDTVEAENRERYGKGPWMTVPYSRIRGYTEQFRAVLGDEGSSPGTHVVVPRAEHDALMEEIAAAQRRRGYGLTDATTWASIVRRAEALRAALATEPANE